MCSGNNEAANTNNGNLERPATRANSRESELRVPVTIDWNYGTKHPGKVLNYDRQHHHVCDKISSDDRTGIVNEKVGKLLQKRALCLTIVCYNEETHHYKYYEGQAFIVRNPKVDQSEKLCTAKHNLVTEPNKKGELETCEEHLITHPSAIEARLNKLPIPNTGWRVADASPIPLRDKELWSTGYDVSLGPRFDGRTILGFSSIRDLNNEAEVYNCVNKGFQYRKGMYIAIVAFSMCGPLKEKVTNTDLDESSFLRYFGREMETIINTGKITYVGENHIEYDINTCGGCSGAAVVLLEQGDDFLKVIAVHAGYKEVFDKNIGFKLAGLM